MSRRNRSLIAIFTLSVVMAALTGVMGIARLLAEAPTAETAADSVLILAGQKPRAQQFFPGGDALFTVSITNTGTVALDTVAVNNASTPSCNRGGLGPLAPGQSTSYTCQRNGVNESFLNVLEVTGTASGGATASHTSDAFVNVLKPEIKILKRPTTQTVREGATAFFTVRIFNTSPDVVLTNITVDDNLVDDCDLDPVVPVNLAPGDSADYPCMLTNVQEPLTTVATVEGTNPVNGDLFTSSDAAWVDVLNLEANLTPQPATIPEPGGLVTYTVNLTNVGSVPVTLVGLTTNRYGNVLDAGNDKIDPAHNTCLPQPGLPVIQPYGAGYTCSFAAQVAAQPSDFSVILTATVKDKNNLDMNATTSATVAVVNVPASISLTLGANPPFINPPSRSVAFSVRVDNTSEADSITLTQIQDEFLGSLDGKGTCDLPVPDIPPGFSYQCEFSTVVSGTAGQQKSRTISVSGRDDDLEPETVSDSDVVTVGITNQPTQYAFMPSVTDDVVGNSCVDSYPLRLNQKYSFFPPARGTQSVFRFDLTRSGNLRVELTNFVPRQGQIVVWSGICGSLELIGRNPDTSLNKTVDLGTRPAGQYIIQLINDGPSNNTDLYGLFVRFN